jgi:protoporphyrinogen/coproporphyrinogen III oxidase
MTGAIVVGAGISGLVRAHALARSGEDVALLEASEAVGGVMQTRRRDGFLLELGPNTVRPTPELWSLVEELGLAGDALTSEPKLPRYVSWQGELHALPASPLALLSTPLLSPAGKLRLLAEPFVAKARLPEESLHSFFARRLGPEVAERFIEPFVGGIFAGSARDLVLSAAFPALDRWEKEKGSLFRGAIADKRRARTGAPPPRGLLSFREGLQALPLALAARLGKRLETAAPVHSLRPVPGGGWEFTMPSSVRTTERATLATPAAEAARLLEPFAPEAARALRAIPHPFLAVAHFSWPLSDLPRPLDGFGHLTVPQPDRRVLGAVWSSRLFAGRAPAGQALVTAFMGGARDPAAASLSDDALAGIAARELAATLEARREPRLVLLTRYPRSIPQYVSGHAARLKILEETEARFPGLALIGNYRGGVSVGDVVRNAESLPL